jgi:hypothetical protein
MFNLCILDYIKTMSRLCQDYVKTMSRLYQDYIKIISRLYQDVDWELLMNLRF